MIESRLPFWAQNLQSLSIMIKELFFYRSAMNNNMAKGNVPFVINHYYVVKKTKLLHGEGIFNIAWEQVQVSTTNLHMGCDRVLVQ